MKIEPRTFTLPNGEVLTVRSDNARAIHLYEKVGFERYGIQPRAFKLKDGTYRDEIIMVKML